MCCPLPSDSSPTNDVAPQEHVIVSERKRMRAESHSVSIGLLDGLFRPSTNARMKRSLRYPG